MVYVLVTCKTMAVYVAILTFVEKEVCQLSPFSIMSDYEVALRSAMRQVYPGCVLNGCWFHLTQAVRRRASKIGGFFASIKADASRHRLFYKFLMLPLLPASKLLDGFRMLKDEVMTLGCEMFEVFVHYFELQWIDKEGPAAISVHDAPNRTNNHVESHNSQLRESIRAAGNFYNFVLKLQADEKRRTHYLDAIGERGTTRKLWKGKTNFFEQRTKLIQAAKRDLSANVATVSEFLQQVSYEFNAGVSKHVTDVDDGVSDTGEDEEEDESREGQIARLQEQIRRLQEQ